MPSDARRIVAYKTVAFETVSLATIVSPVLLRVNSWFTHFLVYTFRNVCFLPVSVQMFAFGEVALLGPFTEHEQKNNDWL